MEKDSGDSEFLIYLNRHFRAILLLLVGLFVIGSGLLLLKSELVSDDKIEIINPTSANASAEIADRVLVVEIAGSVVKPGVYKLTEGSRVQDLLVASGGLSANADRDWVAKNLNLAARLIDSQKIYVYGIGEQKVEVSANNGVGVSGGVKGSVVSVSNLININTASLAELDTLPGIGQVYGQKIIEYRPYSTKEELVTKGAIKQSVFDKIKLKVTVAD